MNKVDIIYRYSADESALRRPPADGDAAVLRLEQGNRGFAQLLDHIHDESGVQRVIPVDPQDLGLVSGLPKQRPFAAVVGCSDARVPIELIFNEGPNDLFVIRVAGNGLDDGVLGSLKYAVDNLGENLKLIVALGHSGCGALTTAVDVFLNPGDYLAFATKHSLRTILDRLLIVVQACARRLAARFGAEVASLPGYRKALVEASIATNAALVAHSIREEFALQTPGGVQTAYGVYLLETREIWAPRLGGGAGAGLASAPRDGAEFFQLGEAIMQSDRIAACLDLEK